MGLNEESVDNETSIGLPASFALAWGVRARPTKGPKRGLSLGRIVDAAVELAETEGLPAVSMQRVAQSLGTSAMTLYRYVGAKDELLALMIDRAVGTPPSAASGEEWRAGLSRWAWSYRAILHRHRWIVRVPITGPPITPNSVAWLEDGLRSLRATGLTEAEKLRVILLLSGYVRNDASLAADLHDAATASNLAMNEVMLNYERLLLRLTDSAQFPALHHAIAGDAFGDDGDIDMTPEFIFGLDRILDGIEVLVRQQSAELE